MRFNHPPDTKKLLLGICASLVAVMIWDTIKYHRRLLEFKNRRPKFLPNENTHQY